MTDYVPFGLRRPVGELSEVELMTELVTYAVAHRATPLKRFLDAVHRIAVLSRSDDETVYQRVLGEVEAITGSRRMPVA